MAEPTMTDTPRDSDDRVAPRHGQAGAVIFAAGALLVATFLVLTAFHEMSGMTRIAPLVFGGTTAILALIVLIGEIRAFVSAAKDAPPSTAGLPRIELFRDIRVFTWLVVLVVAFYLLGSVVGMSLFLVLMLKVYGRETWVTTIVLTVVVIGALYLMFHYVVNLQLYPGVLLERAGILVF